MEYRKKHLKPKKDLEAKLHSAFSNADLMNHKLDFYTSFKKAAFFNQVDHGIKALKSCLVTQKGMEIYLN